MVRQRAVSVFTAVALLVVGIAGAHSGTAGATTADPDLAAQAKRVEDAATRAYNERKWDELRALYAEDAILILPNHEPVRGPAAIVAFLRTMRDVFGEIVFVDMLRASASGTLASLVATYTAYGGQTRFVAHEAFERQSDGVMRVVADMFGSRDPLK